MGLKLIHVSKSDPRFSYIYVYPILKWVSNMQYYQNIVFTYTCNYSIYDIVTVWHQLNNCGPVVNWTLGNKRESNYCDFLSRTYIWQCCLHDIDKFVSASSCEHLIAAITDIIIIIDLHPALHPILRHTLPQMKNEIDKTFYIQLYNWVFWKLRILYHWRR